MIFMTTGEKIRYYRVSFNYTQEQLAEILEVSRQSVSKWETDLAYPETEKLIRLSSLFNVTVDELLSDQTILTPNHRSSMTHYKEYKSDKKLFGLPLYHIIVGKSLKEAKGVLAIGFRAKGIFSLGFLSMGIFSFGLLSLGVISVGVLSLALLSMATFSFGVIAMGALAFGVISIGGISIGLFSVGGLAIGKYFALGDHATGMVAIGKSYANGRLYQFMSQSESFIYDKIAVSSALRSGTPSYLRFIAEFIINLL